MPVPRGWRIGGVIGRLVRGRNYLRTMPSDPAIPVAVRQMIRQAIDLLEAAEAEIRKELKK